MSNDCYIYKSNDCYIKTCFDVYDPFYVKW